MDERGSRGGRSESVETARAWIFNVFVDASFVFSLSQLRHLPDTVLLSSKPVATTASTSQQPRRVHHLVPVLSFFFLLLLTACLRFPPPPTGCLLLSKPRRDKLPQPALPLFPATPNKKAATRSLSRPRSQLLQPLQEADLSQTCFRTHLPDAGPPPNSLHPPVPPVRRNQEPTSHLDLFFCCARHYFVCVTSIYSQASADSTKQGKNGATSLGV